MPLSTGHADTKAKPQSLDVLLNDLAKLNLPDGAFWVEKERAERKLVPLDETVVANEAARIGRDLKEYFTTEAKRIDELAQYLPQYNRLSYEPWSGSCDLSSRWGGVSGDQDRDHFTLRIVGKGLEGEQGSYTVDEPKFIVPSIYTNEQLVTRPGDCDCYLVPGITENYLKKAAESFLRGGIDPVEEVKSTFEAAYRTAVAWLSEKLENPPIVADNVGNS
jgi:hypothetical protein